MSSPAWVLSKLYGEPCERCEPCCLVYSRPPRRRGSESEQGPGPASESDSDTDSESEPLSGLRAEPESAVRWRPPARAGRPRLRPRRPATVTVRSVCVSSVYL